MTAFDAITVVGVAAVVFVTTNVDDLLILVAFFSDDRWTPRSIVLGQLAGIGVLTAVSLAAAWAALALPPAWVALLGVIPLALGIRSLAGLLARKAPDGEGTPLRVEVTRASQVLSVAGVTIANGGDNLGVYIPLFSARPAVLFIYVAVFGALTLVWCLFAWWLVSNAAIGKHVRRAGRGALPFVLLGLGIYILRGAVPLLRR